jgi:hypothetical protein
MNKRSTVSVLRAVNNAKAVAKPCKTTTSTKGSKGTTCELPVHNATFRYPDPDEGELFAGCHPVVGTVVHKYLESPSKSERMFLDAWETCGRNDAKTGARVHVARAARTTLTPYGLACLVRYARGFEDERQAMAALKAPE